MAATFPKQKLTNDVRSEFYSINWFQNGQKLCNWIWCIAQSIFRQRMILYTLKIFYKISIQMNETKELTPSES